MKVSIKIEFANPKDAHTALALIAGLDCPAAFETEAAPVTKDAEPEAPVAEAPKTAKPKSPGRPKKSEAAAAEANPEAEEKSVISASEIRKEMAEAASEPKAPTITIDDARSKLKTYALAHGTDAALQVLALYGAKKISDLPAEKYGEFVAKLEANT